MKNSAICALVLTSLLAGGCVGGCTGRVAPGDSDGDSLPTETDNPSAEGTSVFLITVDTVNRDFLGPFSGGDETPNLSAFYDGAVMFPDTVMPRGLTPVSMGTFLSGLYPRNHGIRDAVNLGGGWPGVGPLLAERFQAAGYETRAYLSNFEKYGEYGFDAVTSVSADSIGIPTFETDAGLVDDMIADLEASDRSKPLFVWIHLLSPHDPFEGAEPWFSERVDPEYRGAFYSVNDEVNTNTLREIALGTGDFDQDDLDYLHAVYSSEVSETDSQLGRVFDALKASGDYDDAVIGVGFDHGETLLQRDGYTFHGCSLYQEVLRVPWAFKAPGAQSGLMVDGATGAVDVSPTLIELAGLEWSGDIDGVSLAGVVRDGGAPSHDVFFSREDSSAGVVRGADKYTLSPEGQFTNCSPYDGGQGLYAFPPESLYDLDADPNELSNLVAAESALAETLRGAVCDWVTGDAWAMDGNDAGNPLIAECGAP